MLEKPPRLSLRVLRRPPGERSLAWGGPARRLEDPAALAHPGVRQALPNDAEALAVLCAEHAAYERLAYDAQGHAGRLQQALAAGRLQVWLAEQAGQVVGYASVTLDFATLTAMPYAHLDCLYLQTQARGQGWGQALMDCVIGFAKAQGCSNLQWQTPDWNGSAITFYARSGAAQASKQRFVLAL
ncbi:MAG: GNAT family N-acetyltransferase [Pseudomonadota bacterium]